LSMRMEIKPENKMRVYNWFSRYEVADKPNAFEEKAQDAKKIHVQDEYHSTEENYRCT